MAGLSCQNFLSLEKNIFIIIIKKKFHYNKKISLFCKGLLLLSLLGSLFVYYILPCVSRTPILIGVTTHYIVEKAGIVQEVQRL